MPLVPSQRCQSSGISFKSPVYGHIVPTGTDRLLDCEAGNSKFVCEGDAA